MIAVGLMSGTSLDGIDAALVRILPRGSRYRVDLLNFETQPFDPELLRALRDLLPPHAGSTQAAAQTHNRLGKAFADAASAVAGDTPVDYVASHGQTVWHDGPARVTLQLADAFVIRERLHATVCYDFRSADCAAGGQGAPLVPYVDALLLGSMQEDRVAINIGGIANLTYVARGAAPQDVVAFDSGPGNMLIDAFITERTNGAQRYDRGGAYALRGEIDAELLRAMLADPYFTLAPPKTAGREQFGAQFLHAHADRLGRLSIEDGAATLAALTAQTLAQAVHSLAGSGTRVLVSGGGSHNAAIMQELQKRLPDFGVETSAAMSLHADAKEAIAFAILGYETLRGRAANVPRVTGAAHPALLGAIAPYDLHRLLEKVDAECRASS